MFEPIAGPARLFAKAGASTVEAPHSLEAFRLASRLGATGVQANVWMTADGVVVLDDSGIAGGRLRRRRVSDSAFADMGSRAVTLEDLIEDLAAEHDLMLDMRAPDAIEKVLSLATKSGVADRLWLVHNDVSILESWRSLEPQLKLVNSVRSTDLPRGHEQHAARLRSLDVDAVALSFDEWTAGHVAVYHRFTRMSFALGPQHDRQMNAVLEMGIDGIVSAYVEQMVDSAMNHGGPNRG